KNQSRERERKVSVVESALMITNGRANVIQLTGESRQKFIDTLVDHGHIPQSANRYGAYIVLLEADRLQHLLQPLMTETEWQSIQVQVGIARRLEPMLRKSGLWPQPPTD